MFSMGTEVRWRAWLGVGDESRISEIDVAEFATLTAACAWVERRLYAEWARPGLTVFGSVDKGVYRPAGPGAKPCWVLDQCAAGLDADLVDGQVSWRKTGRSAR
jgi:hypothetical protein